MHEALATFERLKYPMGTINKAISLRDEAPLDITDEAVTTWLNAYLLNSPGTMVDAHEPACQWLDAVLVGLNNA
jgi:hypothetical protein